MINQFKYWLCRSLRPDRVFNKDMSREIDRLVEKTERLKEDLNAIYFSTSHD